HLRFVIGDAHTPYLRPLPYTTLFRSKTAQLLLYRAFVRHKKDCQPYIKSVICPIRSEWEWIIKKKGYSETIEISVMICGMMMTFLRLANVIKISDVIVVVVNCYVRGR